MTGETLWLELWLRELVIRAMADDIRRCRAGAIGAGDNFDAGFVRGQMLGWSVEASLALGHRCAVSSLTEPGGIRGQLCDSLIETSETDE